MTKEEIKKQVEDIKKIHKSYKDKLFVLKNKQDKIIYDFSNLLKNKKIEEIKKQLGTL